MAENLSIPGRESVGTPMQWTGGVNGGFSSADPDDLLTTGIEVSAYIPGEEHNLPHKNAVTRAVGVNELVEVDTFELDVQTGDAFLLCSDGLSGYFKSDDHIVELMQLEDPKTIAERAIQFANAGGGKDNITAVIVRVTGDDSDRADLQRTMEVLKATPYFQYLAYKEMVQVVNLSRRDELDGGQRLFAEGEDPGVLFIVASGKVRLDRDGRAIATMLPGDHFAETAIIDETPQGFGATAVGPTVVIAFPRDRFMELLRQAPQLAVKLLWNFLQTFAFRMRAAPYEAFLTDRAPQADEHTPPSGTLVFNEDRRRDAGAGASSDPEVFDRSEIAQTLPSIPPRHDVPEDAIVTLEADAAAVDPDATIDNERLRGRDIKDTLPPGTLDDVHTDGESDDVESLRQTVQMDQEVDDRARTHNALPHVPRPHAARAAAPAAKAAPTPRVDSGLGKPISGESVVKETPPPQSQGLKRTKLVVGEGEFDNSEKTRDVPSLRTRKTEADSTLELDLADDNIEEVN